MFIWAKFTEVTFALTYVKVQWYWTALLHPSPVCSLTSSSSIASLVGVGYGLTFITSTVYIWWRSLFSSLSKSAIPGLSVNITLTKKPAMLLALTENTFRENTTPTVCSDVKSKLSLTVHIFVCLHHLLHKRSTKHSAQVSPSQLPDPESRIPR